MVEFQAERLQYRCSRRAETVERGLLNGLRQTYHLVDRTKLQHSVAALLYRLHRHATRMPYQCTLSVLSPNKTTKLLLNDERNWVFNPK